jgi:hypothetical protein
MRYHGVNRQIQIIFVLWALSVFLLVSIPAQAAVDQAIPILPTGAIKQIPTDIELFQRTSEALGTRTPLVLVHGLGSEHVAECHWTKLIKKLSSDADFCRTYKIYLVRYDTTARQSVIVPQFQKTLLKLYKVSGNRPITIVALSLGGNLAQEAMMDKEADKTVGKVLTFGAPFHGTPFFTPSWFQYSLSKNPTFLWSRYNHSLCFRLYFYLHRNLAKDFAWDNSDYLMPDIGAFHSDLPFGPSGILSVAADANGRINKLNLEHPADKTKFITYAGYLKNVPIEKKGLLSGVRFFLFVHYLYPSAILPTIISDKHRLLRIINSEASRMICKQEPGSQRLYAYAMNDGVTPIISALFLPNSYCQDHHFTDEDSLKNIAAAIDVSKARVFRDVDHISFVDGVHPLFKSRLVEDKLHPQEAKRTIFDWILSDLMQAGSSAGAVSKHDIYGAQDNKTD